MSKQNQRKAKARKGKNRMNEQRFGNKMKKDGINVKEAIDRMAGDGVSHLKDEFNEFADTVKDNVHGTVSSIKKDVNFGLKRYNSKAEEIADKLHKGIRQNVRKYPWVVISLGLIFGFLLGIVLKPSRQS